MSRKPAASAAAPTFAGRRRLGRELVPGRHRREGVHVAGVHAGGDDGRGRPQVVAERLRERLLVLRQEPQALEGAHGRQPDPAPAGTDRHPRVHPGALDRVVDHAGDALVRVVLGAGLRVVAGSPHDPVVAVEHRQAHAGAGRHSLDGEEGDVVQVERARLALRQLDVAAEGRERRGVLPHVERWVHLAAQDHPVLVATGRPGADRQGQEPGDAHQGRTGADPDQLALGALHRGRRTSVAQAEPGQGQHREHAALEPQRLGPADAEQDDQREQRQGRQQRQRRGDQGPPGADEAQHHGQQPGDQPQQPGQREQPRLPVHRRQGGQQVLPAEQGLVDQHPPAVRARGREPLRAQGQDGTEEEVPDHHDQRRDRARPAQHHHDHDGREHGEEGAEHPDPPELGLGERRPETGQGCAGQREHERGVDADPAGLAQGEPAEVPHPRLTSGSTAGGRRGRPCRPPGPRRGHPSR